MRNITTASCQTRPIYGSEEKPQIQLLHEQWPLTFYNTSKEKQPLLPLSTSISFARHRSNTSMRRSLAAALLAALSLVILISYYLFDLQSRESSFPSPESVTGFSTDLTVWGFDKPEDIKVIGLVFFGRRSRVEILRCYLERNLVDNGGWLDEIHWVKNTDNHKDLEYLEEIMASSQRYKVIELKGTGFVGYGQAWEKLEPGSLYVKIDDDVVWFEDETIPRIVTMKLLHPEYLLVSANMINSPLMGWLRTFPCFLKECAVYRLSLPFLRHHCYELTETRRLPFGGLASLST
jgi:hypothetical protein